MLIDKQEWLGYWLSVDLILNVGGMKLVYTRTFTLQYFIERLARFDNTNFLCHYLDFNNRWKHGCGILFQSNRWRTEFLSSYWLNNGCTSFWPLISECNCSCTTSIGDSEKWNSCKINVHRGSKACIRRQDLTSRAYGWCWTPSPMRQPSTPMYFICGRRSSHWRAKSFTPSAPGVLGRFNQSSSTLICLASVYFFWLGIWFLMLL